MLALGFHHVTFPFNVISYLANSGLLHATKLNGNKCETCFRKPNHISIHPKVSITDGAYITLNVLLVPL